jgi:uncharacterized protein (DUF2461 family)
VRTFEGFGDEAFIFFEQVAARPSWEHVSSLRDDWDGNVHAPMEHLLEALREEFGGDAYAYNLHRDPYLWSHQVGILNIAGNVVYRAVLSIDGLVAEAGWTRSDRESLARYRAAVANDLSGQDLAGLLGGLVNAGFDISAKSLRGVPRGWTRDHPRLELARYLSLTSSSLVDPRHLEDASRCLAAVRSRWRELTPLMDWLVREVAAPAT